MEAKYKFQKASNTDDQNFFFLTQGKVVSRFSLKFVFSKKATKIDEIFTVDLTVCSKCQIDGEEFVKFCGLLRKQEL